MTKRFPQKETIKSQKHFDSLFQDAKKIHSAFFIICYTHKLMADRRFAFITSKKVGNAIYRNKARRRLKDIVRNHQHYINKKYDMIIIAKAAAVSEEFSKIEKTFVSLLQEHNLWLD